MTTMTDEVSALIYADQRQRLKVLVVALVRAFEALEPPKDYVSAERAAKALMGLNKAVSEIFAEDKLVQGDEWDWDGDEAGGEAEDQAEDAINSSGDPEYEGMYDWQIALERQLIQLANDRRDASLRAEGSA